MTRAQLKPSVSIWLLLSLAALCGISHAADAIPIITDAKELSKHIGEEVTLVGEVSNSKMPQILGVDVKSDNPDLRGKMAEAHGTLERYEVTKAQADAADFANRGHGVFYRLYDFNKKTEAQVRKPK